MTAVGVTAVGVTAVRNNLEFKMIINIGTTIILRIIVVRSFRISMNRRNTFYA